MPTIEKRGDSYKITVSCGYNSKGVQQRRRMTWRPEPNMTARQIEKELNRQATLFEEKVRNGGGASGAVKFEQLAEEWLDTYAEKHLKERTVSSYRSLTKRTYAALGAKRVDKITVRDVQSFIDNLSEAGVKIHHIKKDTPDEELPPPSGLSPKTVRGYLSFVSCIMSYAARLEMIASNPCDKVVLPSLNTAERECYTLDEAARLLELLEGEDWQFRMFFTLAIYSGARRAELLGLEWKDFDFNSCTVSICRNSLYTKRRGVYTDTVKTKGSNRVLRLPEGVFDILSQYREWQQGEREKLGSQWIDTDRLFTRWNGEPMFPNTPAWWFKKFCDRTGMRYVNVHGLRHLNASMLINASVDIRTVSAALGHSNTSTTLNIYAHTFAEAQAKAADAIGNALPIGKTKKRAEA